MSYFKAPKPNEKGVEMLCTLCGLGTTKWCRRCNRCKHLCTCWRQGYRDGHLDHLKGLSWQSAMEDETEYGAGYRFAQDEAIP